MKTEFIVTEKRRRHHLNKDPIKGDWENSETPFFSLYINGRFLLPWSPQLWSDLPKNLMQPFPHPKNATDKIWLKLTSWSWEISSKVWTATDEDDGALLYYNLILRAFGSSELKSGDIIFSIISLREKNSCSRANNSKVNTPIQPKFELIQAFKRVLVTCRFDKNPVKSDWEKLEISFFQSSRACNSKWLIKYDRNSNSS